MRIFSSLSYLLRLVLSLMLATFAIAATAETPERSASDKLGIRSTKAVRLHAQAVAAQDPKVALW
jgi:hypothetical protein